MTVRPSPTPGPSHSPWGGGNRSGPDPDPDPRLVLSATGDLRPTFPAPRFLFFFSHFWGIGDCSGATPACGMLGLGKPRVLLPGCPHPASHHLSAPAFPTACGYFCHSTCAPQAPPCPVPPDLLHTALGVHPETGTGTAYEGFLSVSWRWGRGRTGVGGLGAWRALPCLPSPRCHGPLVSGGAGNECLPPSVTRACCCLTPRTRGSARPAGPSCRHSI